jgi:hypothetical protein
METLKMVKILNFEDFATKREIEKLVEYAERELAAPTEQPKIKM